VRAAVAAPLAGLVLALAGCASDTTATTQLPTCSAGGDGDAAKGVVLMAQSVPTAAWVPCLSTALPLGWSFHALDARSGGSTFSLDSDRDGQQAIEVRLDDSCDTNGSTEIPTDREGLERYERVTLTTPRFEGERYYVFEGGCITFAFRLNGESRGEPLALATQSIGAVSRSDLVDQVHDDSGGRLNLDPDEEG
jgi:hypothetical protein